MTEVEALTKISDAIRYLADVLAGGFSTFGLLGWLFLLFKNFSGDNRSALSAIAAAIEALKGKE